MTTSRADFGQCSSAARSTASIAATTPKGTAAAVGYAQAVSPYDSAQQAAIARAVASHRNE